MFKGLNDSLRNLISGMGTEKYDKKASNFFHRRLLNDDELMNLYDSSWMAGKIVDIPVYDALRKGRDWQAKQEQITLIEKEEKRLRLFDKLIECKIMARLWGGAAIMIGIKGDDVSEPLDVDSLDGKKISYLTVLTRRELQAGTLSRNVDDAYYGQPEYYSIVSGDNDFLKIHPSRLILQQGNREADKLLAQYTGWGASVLRKVYDAVMNSESVSSNVASLVFEMNVDTLGIPDLMDSLSEEQYAKRILDRLTIASTGKSVNKSLIHDANEQYARHSASFASLPETIQSFLLIVSGASDIPLTRFLGQAPSGLSSTGEGDMKNYYDRVQSIQELEISPALHIFDELLIRTALGSRPPEIFYEWSPLEQLNELQQADIGLKNAQTAEIISRTNLFTPEELRTSLSNQLIENGFYPGLGETMTETGDAPDYGFNENENEDL